MIVRFTRFTQHFNWTEHAIERLENRHIYRNQHECELDILRGGSKVIDSKTNTITIHTKNAQVVLDREFKTIITIMDKVKNTPKKIRQKFKKKHSLKNLTQREKRI